MSWIIVPVQLLLKMVRIEFFLKEHTKTLQSLNKNCSVSNSMILKYLNCKHKHLNLSQWDSLQLQGKYCIFYIMIIYFTEIHNKNA